MKKFFLVGVLTLAISMAVGAFIWRKYPREIANQTKVKLCENYSGLPKITKPSDGMVWIEPGSFIMGNNQGHKDKDSGHYDPLPEEGREHKVELDGFFIDQHEVTNAQFADFVKATGYVTIAERKPEKSWFPPNTPPELMVAGSAVFRAPREINNIADITQWWTFVPGANWRHPLGPDSDIKGSMNHPVVHIAFVDAQAYAKWARRELPTEAQWEYAAKGGLDRKTYAWGNEFKLGKNYMANTFQGDFPKQNTADDGFLGTAPVGCFPSNPFGLFDVAGNVWEIVLDNYQPSHEVGATKNPPGPATSFDPTEPAIPKHVIKGGSYLCAPGFCMRYRPTARQAADFSMGTSHIGFRTVLNVKQAYLPQ